MTSRINPPVFEPLGLTWCSVNEMSAGLTRTKTNSQTFDLHACCDTEGLYLGAGDYMRVQTGIAIDSMPLGCELQIRSDHHLAESAGVFVLNSPCSVPPTCKKELYVILSNQGKTAFKIVNGMKIALLAVVPICSVNLYQNTQVTIDKQEIDNDQA